MPASRGITLIDVAAVLVLACALGPSVLPFHEKQRQIAQREMDTRQLGRAMTAMHLFALDTNGAYPLPSTLDIRNTTVHNFGIAKDNTGNILSILIFNGLITPQELVSPAEAATATVVVDSGYQYENPVRAVVPAQALWDPGFSGTPLDFASPRRTISSSNQSYAHILPFGRRRDEQWRIRSDRQIPILANRGPMYASNDSAPYPAATGGRWTLLQGVFGTFSNTLLIHGPRTSWEGLVAYNDLHVEFWLGPTNQRVTYERASGSPRFALDNIFVKESDELMGDPPFGITNGRNLYMRPVAQVVGQPSFPSVTLWRD